MIGGKPRKAVKAAGKNPSKKPANLGGKRRRNSEVDEEIVTPDSQPIDYEEEKKVAVASDVTFDPFEFGIIDSRLSHMVLATPVSQAEIRSKYESYFKLLSCNSLVVNSIKLFTAITTSGSEKLL